jgi:hypothetical protein
LQFLGKNLLRPAALIAKLSDLWANYIQTPH